MGYDVHITRKARWSDEDGAEISQAEWTAIVNSDPEMRLDGFAQASTPAGDVLRYENEGLAVWIGYSNQTDQNKAWFDYRGGEIVAKNPDQEVLRKMWSLAERLSAKLQGDDGENYDSSGQVTS